MLLEALAVLTNTEPCSYLPATNSRTSCNMTLHSYFLVAISL